MTKRLSGVTMSSLGSPTCSAACLSPNDIRYKKVKVLKSTPPIVMEDIVF